MMRRDLAWVVIGIITFIQSLPLLAQRPADSTQLPVPRLERTPTVDVKHISLDLRFDWKKKHAYGTATLTISLLTESDIIKLDAGKLTIHSVTLGNDSSLPFQYDGSDKNDNLMISLGRTYKPDQEMQIKINYHTNHVNETDPNNLGGSYGKGLRFFGPTFTDRRKRKQIWTAGIPESNRYWFPGYDSPNDFRTTEVKATVEAGLTVVSNGELIDVTSNGDGTTTFHWKKNQPYANHQTSIVVGEYVDLSQTVDNIEIHNYSYPDEIQAVKASTERLTDMMKFFSEKTEMKYPYKTYNQVFVQEFPWGGGHYMNSSTLSDNMIDDEGTHADFLYLWDGVEANDLAAQWFGNFITPKSWDHAWLGKSFATYFSNLYSDYKNGRDEFQLWNRAFNHSVYLGDWYAGLKRPLVTNRYEDPGTMINDNYALYHGAEVLHLLRHQLGEANWWKSIGWYVKAHANQSVTTADFQRAIKTATGQDMDWFFNQWVYGIGHPIFQVTKMYDPVEKQLSIKLSQTQTADTTNRYTPVKYFRGWIDILIDQQLKRVWLEPKQENLFSFACQSKPQLINVDYGSAWIKEMKFEKSFEELLYQFANDKDVTGRTTAMNELAAIAKNDSTSTMVKQRIINNFHDVISSNSYWRFRLNALTQLRGIVKLPYDTKTIALLEAIIRKESSWLKSSAIFFLGNTNDPKYVPLYLACLNDKSDRVISAAALSLAKTKTSEVFDVLLKLKDKPSWKNQSLISAMNALKTLGDPRAVDVALQALIDTPAKPRWTLANNSWDYRVVAAETLAAFGKGNLGFPIVYERFLKSWEEKEINDLFNNVMLIAILADARGLQIFEILYANFKDDPNALVAVRQYEQQLKEALK